MIRADALLQALKQAGFGVCSGVPCSYLTPLINAVIGAPEMRYVGAANEGDAVAIACGAEVGGTRAMVICQNSGLGNALNPLTSLTVPMRIPVLLVTTWRGQPDGSPDEPQHTLMGRITPSLLDVIEVPWEVFPDGEEDVAPALARAVGHMQSNRTPYGFILKEGTIAPRALPDRPATPPRRLPMPPDDPPAVARHEQDDVLRAVQAGAGTRDAVLSTTGYTSRALYALEDRPNQFYMVGSMGCASSMGLGLALVQPRKRVIVLDGDGAALMRMGALATIGHERPRNLIHILLDNGVHDSTGGQATVSPSVDFALVARACGYPNVIRIDGLDGLTRALHDGAADLTFLHIKTKPRENRKLPRPAVTPAQVAERFHRWLEAGDAL